MKVFTKNSLSQLTKTISLTIVTAAFSVAIAAQERRLEEVIVTAQKRAQSSQDIPVAVTAISSEMIDNLGLTQTQDLVKLTPSLSVGGGFGNNKQATSFSLRGVGTSVFSIGVEQSVAVILDDVSTVQAGQALSNLVDIERIEVLRGPQSTLFGKSASAGVLSIVTKAPADEFEGTVELLATDDNEERLQGSISGPITDSLAYRLTGHWGDRDGYIDNLTTNKDQNGEKNKGLRGKLQWDINENIDLMLIGYWSEDESTCCALTWRDLDPNARVFGFVPGEVAADITPSDNNRDFRADDSPEDETENSGASVRFNMALGEFTLTSITAIDNWKYNNVGDTDSSESDVAGALSGGAIHGGIVQHSDIETDFFSQEIRLISPSYSNFDYLVGLYYADAETEKTFVRVPLLAADYNGTAGTESIALFGQATWRFNEATSITMGLRWNDEEITADFNDYMVTPTYHLEAKDSNAEVLGNISVQHFFTEDIMFYARYAQGYKGQAFDLGSSFNEDKAENPAAPETSDAYEIGIKSTLLDNRLRLNVTAFLTEYDDFQAQSGVFNPDGTFSTRLNNVGKLETQGVEVEGVALLGDNFTLTFGAAYIDAVIEEFDNADCYPGQTADEGCQDGIQDIAGGDLPNSPEWKWNVVADYHLEFESMPFYGFVNLAYVWQDDVNFSLIQSPLTVQESYGVGDINFGINDKNDRYRITAFVNNFTDEHFSTSISDLRDLYGGAQAMAGTLPRGAQRYYGVRLKFNF